MLVPPAQRASRRVLFSSRRQCRRERLAGLEEEALQRGGSGDPPSAAAVRVARAAEAGKAIAPRAGRKALKDIMKE